MLRYAHERTWKAKWFKELLKFVIATVQLHHLKNYKVLSILNVLCYCYLKFSILQNANHLSTPLEHVRRMNTLNRKMCEEISQMSIKFLILHRTYWSAIYRFIFVLIMLSVKYFFITPNLNRKLLI